MPDDSAAHQDAFERLDIDQGNCEPIQLRLHMARYEFAREWAAGKRVLDIACGTGYGTAILARDGAACAVGVDIDSGTIERARACYDLPNLSFLVGDAERPPITGPFDLIVSFETIEHLQGPERFLKAVCQLLAPHGFFLVSSPCRHAGSINDRPHNPFHVREWNRAEFAQFLGDYFGSVGLFGQLIEFAKSRLPLNRSLARIITALISPSRLNAMYSLEVKSLENLPHFSLRIAYLVAVCAQPRL
jgi:SAM-dependent methyltransferase